MRLYKFFWDTHKWVGIVSAVAFLNVSLTGFLLLIKKDYEWIQPPTQKGEAGSLGDLITIQELFSVVLGAGHEDFKEIGDIDRVDFRPDKRVHKVRSRHNYAEIQVDAVSGQILRTDWRPSDLIENLHDGRFFGAWAHAWLMPLVAFALLFLMGSGLYLWLEPLIRRRRRRRRRSQ